MVSARAFLPLYNLRLPSFGPSQSRLPFITHEQDVEIFDIRIGTLQVGLHAKISILCFSRKRKCNKAKKDKSYEVHWRWRYQWKGGKEQSWPSSPLLSPSSYSSHAMDVCQFHSGAQGRGKLGEKWKYPRGGVGAAVRGREREDSEEGRREANSILRMMSAMTAA